MDQTFTLAEEAGEGVTVAVASGELDVTAAPAFRAQLERAVDGGCAVIIVDLLGVTFLDSSALGVLIGAHQRCDERGASLRLVVADPRIRKVFQITGLTELFTMVSTRAGAAST